MSDNGYHAATSTTTQQSSTATGLESSTYATTSTASSAEPTTDLVTSVVTESASTNGHTTAQATTVVITSINTPSTTNVATLTASSNGQTVQFTTTYAPSLSTVVYSYTTSYFPTATTVTGTNGVQTVVLLRQPSSSAPIIPGGEIAGIVVGCLAALAMILGFLAWFLIRSSRQRKEGEDQDTAGKEEKEAGTAVLERHEKDGTEVKELHEDTRKLEAGGGPIHEMHVIPSELEAEPVEQARSPVEIGVKSPSSSSVGRVDSVRQLPRGTAQAHDAAPNLLCQAKKRPSSELGGEGR
jgi:hypothetical protein